MEPTLRLRTMEPSGPKHQEREDKKRLIKIQNRQSSSSLSSLWFFYYNYLLPAEATRRLYRIFNMFNMIIPGGNLGSTIASLMFCYTVFKEYFPYELQKRLEEYFHKRFSFSYANIEITFSEGEGLMRGEAFSLIESYLSKASTLQAKRLRGEVSSKNKTPLLSMDEHEEVAEEFQGVQLLWRFGKYAPKSQTISFYPANDKRFYTLTFHKRHRNLIVNKYLPQVIKRGREIRSENQQRRLYTNIGMRWSHVTFDHRASFETLAFDPELKKDIVDDLISFSKGEEFYRRIGRTWKRGYLLYGPPGTGKSTMIAAIANLLNYDVYDLELTAVRDNSELRRLLIEIPSKSVIVIEDIDCSLKLTGQRKKVKKQKEKEKREKQSKPLPPDEDSNTSQVTLSGLLNFIDGLWSACGGERVIVFTTNFIEKLDPALIRKGRMDRHIELGYCGFEAFKILSKNYLQIESHDLYPMIRELLEDGVKITPAEVAEYLMPKSLSGNPDEYLESLVRALQKNKEEAILKMEKDSSSKETEEKQVVGITDGPVTLEASSEEKQVVIDGPVTLETLSSDSVDSC